jgi:hypothetical protein
MWNWKCKSWNNGILEDWNIGENKEKAKDTRGLSG